MAGSRSGGEPWSRRGQVAVSPSYETFTCQVMIAPYSCPGNSCPGKMYVCQSTKSAEELPRILLSRMLGE